MPAPVERLQRALDVLALEHQVEVVARLRAAARPRGEAAAEQERDVGLAQRGGGLLQRRLDVGERLLVVDGHTGRPTRVRGRSMAIRSENDAGREVRDECAIRIAATGRHPPRPRRRRGALGRGVRRPARPRRPRPARRRPHHARRAGAGGDGRRAAARALDGIPVLAVLGNHDWHVEPPRRGRRGAARRAAIDVLEREHRVLELCGAEVGVAGCKGFARRLRRCAHPRLRRADDARGLRGVDARGRGARRGAARDRAVPVPHRAAALRADHGDAARASAPTSGPSSARTAWPRRCASTIPTSSCTGTRTPARSPGALGEVPVYNVSVPVLGEDFWVFEMTGARRMPSEVH